MSGVQGSFKFPSIMKRRKIDHCLPTFSWELLKHVEEIGSGAFGSIYSAIYGPEEKLKGEYTVAKDRFIKEAKLHVIRNKAFEYSGNLVKDNQRF